MANPVRNPVRPRRGARLRASRCCVARAEDEDGLRNWAYRRLPWLLGGVVVVLIIVFVYALATGLPCSTARSPIRRCSFAVCRSAGGGRFRPRPTPPARQFTVRNGGARGRLLISDARHELLAVHDPLHCHGRGRSGAAAVARVLFLGRRLVVFPVVLIYTGAVFWIFRGKVGKVAQEHRA